MSSKRRSISRRGESQQRRVQVDVVPARHLGLKAGAELEHRRQMSPHDDLARCRLQDAGDALEQRRLA